MDSKPKPPKFVLSVAAAALAEVTKVPALLDLQDTAELPQVIQQNQLEEKRVEPQSVPQ
jgi:hypothetical protein